MQGQIKRRGNELSPSLSPACLGDESDLASLVPGVGNSNMCSSTLRPHALAASYQGLFQEQFASSSSITGGRRGSGCAASERGAFRWDPMFTGAMMPGSIHHDPLGTRGRRLGKQAYCSQMTQKYIGREET